MAVHLRRPKSPEDPRPRLHRPARGVRYRRLLVGLSPGPASPHAVATACAIAAGTGAHLAAVAAIEVPLDLPLDAVDRETEAAAREAIASAEALGATHGIAVDGVLLRVRDAAEAIVAEAVARDAQVVVLGAEWPQGGGRVRRLDRTTEHVLKHTPCRVLLIGDPAPGTAAASPSEPVFRAGRPSDYWPAGDFVDPDGSTSR